MGPILRWIRLLVLAIACAAPASATAQAAAPQTRVLIVSALPPGAPALGAFSEALREAMRTGLAAPAEFYDEPLDLDRFPERARDADLDDYFAEKYRGRRIDVIVAVQTVSLRFVTARLSRVFPGVPIVYALAVEPMADSVPPATYVVGRRVRLPFAETFALARALQPDAERVVVVGGASAVDSVAIDRAVRDLEPLRGGLPLDVMRDLSYDSLRVALRRVPPRSIVLLAHFRRDARGQAFILPEITPSLARASAAPLYSVYDVLVGRGIVGGAVVELADEGTRTGRLAVRVLRRRPGDAIPQVDTAGVAPMVDWRALQRWGLSESRVPSGTSVLFRTPTTWERHRVPILLALGLIAVETLLIARLLRERRERLGAQRQVDEQARYERTIAELTTDAVRHAPEETPRALEDAVARLARYAGASRAVLVRHADGSPEPETVLAVAGVPGNGHLGNGSRGPGNARAAASRLELPLVADGRALGVIELHADDGVAWTPDAVSRLGAASEIIAGAVARARAAELMREEEALNSAVLASLSTNIAIVNRDGVIVRVNDGWRAQARRGGVAAARDAFVGESYLQECRRAEARGCEEAGEVAAGLEAVLRGAARSFRREYRLATSDERWWEVSVDCLATADGGAVVSHLDVTERRLAELRAEEAQRQLAHMGRVAIVGELTASLSHELRQPLFVIRTNARLALQALDKAPADVAEALDVLSDIAAAERRATDVIESIRAMLRKGDEARAPVDLNALCRQAVRLVRRDAEQRRVRVDLELAADALVVSADAVQLQQVLVNLLLNALEATAGTAGAGGARRVLVGTASKADEAELFVRDTGPGLPHGTRERLFESFFTTKAHGLGLGLAIVRSIVERHGGSVWAEDAPGGGAIFRVRLPAA